MRAAVEGRAIIGSSVPAVVDFLADGVTGVVVEPDDALGLAGALLDLAADPATRDQLGAASGRWAASRCTWTAQVDGLVAAYEM
jgi:colanic acid/amylovoran biosynthesis glycosyltransferase